MNKRLLIFVLTLSLLLSSCIPGDETGEIDSSGRTKSEASEQTTAVPESSAETGAESEPENESDSEPESASESKRESEPATRQEPLSPTKGLEFDVVGGSYVVIGIGEATDSHIVIPSQAGGE